MSSSSACESPDLPMNEAAEAALSQIGSTRASRSRICDPTLAAEVGSSMRHFRQSLVNRMP